LDTYNDIFEKRKELAIYWYNKASDLRGSAGALWASMDDPRSNEIVEQLGLGTGFSMKAATSPVYLMLCGMSLELLYKAIVVAKGEKPNTNSHKLTDLASNAGVSLTEQEVGLLEILSESIIWDGRYPVPKEQKHIQGLIDLKKEHLYDKKQLGELYVLSPNGALNWDSFDKLWNDSLEIYLQGHY